MAVAILDNGSGSGLLGSHVGAGSYTFTKTITANGSGTRSMFFGVIISGPGSPGAATYGTQTCTAVAAASGSGLFARGYYILESGIAAASSTTFSVATNDDTAQCVIAAITFTGVASASAAGTPSVNDNTSPGNIAITGLGAGDYAVCMSVNGDTGLAITAGTETNGYRLNSGSAYELASLAGSSGTISWTWGVGDTQIGQGVGFVASGGGAAAAANFLTLLGVGA